MRGTGTPQGGFSTRPDLSNDVQSLSESKKSSREKKSGRLTEKVSGFRNGVVMPLSVKINVM